MATPQEISNQRKLGLAREFLSEVTEDVASRADFMTKGLVKSPIGKLIIANLLKSQFPDDPVIITAGRIAYADYINSINKRGENGDPIGSILAKYSALYKDA